MSKSKFYVGLEIGTSKVCMTVGEVKADGSTIILAVEETRSVGVRSGEIHDSNNVRSCIKSVLQDAEDHSDVDISSVALAISGEKIVSLNNSGTYRLPDNEDDILPEHVKEASAIAKEVPLPKDHWLIHTVERGYQVDGKPVQNPVGESGRTVEASFHIVHGPKQILQQALRCVREIPLEVECIVFAPIAAAQAALTLEQKADGALVVDLGGGTTSYSYYESGALTATGCIPVGGDTITSDIHLVTNVSISRSEALKRQEGNACAAAADSTGLVKVPDSTGLSNQSVEREVLNGVIRARYEEIFEMIDSRLPDDWRHHVGAGVFLVGGASQMQGLGELVSEIFFPHVYRYEPPELSGNRKYYEDPNYSTPIGLLRYALVLDADAEKAGIVRRFGRFLRSLWPF